MSFPLVLSAVMRQILFDPKDRTIAGVFNNVSENFTGKLVNFASRDKKIKPWVRHVPQTIFPEFYLRDMHSIKKIK
ncbi:hypothetical protein OROHE_026570 [Orobanche hederae]